MGMILRILRAFAGVIFVSKLISLPSYVVAVANDPLGIGAMLAIGGILIGLFAWWAFFAMREPVNALYVKRGAPPPLNKALSL